MFSCLSLLSLFFLPFLPHYISSSSSSSSTIVFTFFLLFIISTFSFPPHFLVFLFPFVFFLALSFFLSLLLLLLSYTNLLKTCVQKAMSQNDMRETTTQQQFVHVHDCTSYTLPLESTTNALFYFLPTLCSS